VSESLTPAVIGNRVFPHVQKISSNQINQMAGVKGKSGGKRAGAGRKAKPTVKAPAGVDMLEFLQSVALGHLEASTVQVRAAIAAVQYTHAKVGEGGKKQRRQADAEKVAGRFTPAAPPRLAAVGGKRV
jgi:phage terminase small subunit